MLIPLNAFESCFTAATMKYVALMAIMIHDIVYWVQVHERPFIQCRYQATTSIDMVTIDSYRNNYYWT